MNIFSENTQGSTVGEINILDIASAFKECIAIRETGFTSLKSMVTVFDYNETQTFQNLNTWKHISRQ